MKRYHQLMFEMLELRENNYDLFLDKLYDAITTEFLEYFVKELLKEEIHRETLNSLIKHFEKKEEYEKCNVLLNILNNNKLNNNKNI